MKRYRVIFTNGNDVIIEAESSTYGYSENAQKT